MLFEEFEWDEHKNQINIRKHKISFQEAETVFDDKEAIFISDPDYSEPDDDRFLIFDPYFQHSPQNGKLFELGLFRFIRVRYK